MPAPDQQAVVEALTDVIEFGHRVGLPAKVAALEAFREQVRAKKPTLKYLQSTVKDAADRAFHAIRGRVFEDGLRVPRVGEEALADSFHEVFRVLNEVIYPPRVTAKEIDVSGFPSAGAVESKVVSCLGDPAEIPRIFEGSVSLVRDYCRAVVAADMEAAYALTSPELRSWMSFPRFLAEHGAASDRYGGPPVEYLIESFGWIFPDAESRNHAEVGRIVWPRYVPKPIRRATVYGFWVRDREEVTGCSGGHWVTEHDDGFRIAKFTFYTM